MNPKELLKKLDFYGVNLLAHSQHSLTDHLLGTHRILLDWDVERYIALAGLCHSVYGTESYTKESVPLSDREYLQSLVGEDAERIVYYFGCHKKDSLWENLSKTERFRITDRFEDKEVEISEQDFKDLVTLTLANWLEQRPRVSEKYLYLREQEFNAAQPFLPTKAFESFRKAYQR